MKSKEQEFILSEIQEINDSEKNDIMGGIIQDDPQILPKDGTINLYPLWLPILL